MTDDAPRTELRFDADVFDWRGPSPFFFVALPPPQAAQVETLAKAVSYGWGMIPVQATIGETRFATALFAKDGTYLLPLKAAVRRSAGITVGDRIAVTLTIQAALR